MAEQEYDLMHKDDVVASLQLDDLSGAILKVTPSASPELLPVSSEERSDRDSFFGERSSCGFSSEPKRRSKMTFASSRSVVGMTRSMGASGCSLS